MIKNYNIIIKYLFIFISYSNIIFFKYNHINIDKKKFIETDNEIKINYYENEMYFINKTKVIKPIAIYHPEYFKISYNKYFNSTQRINNFTFDNIESLIYAQVNLAKRHQIFGFSIYYNIISLDNYQKKNNGYIFTQGKLSFFIIIEK